MTTEDILNTYCIKQAAGENGFDFETGFLRSYAVCEMAACCRNENSALMDDTVWSWRGKTP